VRRRSIDVDVLDRPDYPGEAIACPASSFCALADGTVEKGAAATCTTRTSLGGTWNEAFKTHEWRIVGLVPNIVVLHRWSGRGSIRYSTKPASTSWTSVTIGSGSDRERVLPDIGLLRGL